MTDHDELLVRADAWTHPPSGEPLTSSVRSHAVRTGFDGALDLVAELAAALRAALELQERTATKLRDSNKALRAALATRPDDGPWPKFCPGCMGEFHEDGIFTPPAAGSATATTDEHDG